MEKGLASGRLALRRLTRIGLAGPAQVGSSVSRSVTRRMRKRGDSLLSFILVTVLCIPMHGCVTSTRAGYSASEAAVAQVDGFENIRAYADAPAGSSEIRHSGFRVRAAGILKFFASLGADRAVHLQLAYYPHGATNIHGLSSMSSQV